MKFLVDAQLPYRLKSWLLAKNFDAIHTADLPARNLSGDREIARIADMYGCVVITKDSDFLKLHILESSPAKLLTITTGNIVNQQLLFLFEQNFEAILRMFESYNVVELNNSFIIGHDYD